MTSTTPTRLSPHSQDKYKTFAADQQVYRSIGILTGAILGLLAARKHVPMYWTWMASTWGQGLIYLAMALLFANTEGKFKRANEYLSEEHGPASSSDIAKTSPATTMDAHRVDVQPVAPAAAHTTPVLDDASSAAPAGADGDDAEPQRLLEMLATADSEARRLVGDEAHDVQGEKPDQPAEQPAKSDTGGETSGEDADKPRTAASVAKATATRAAALASSGARSVGSWIFGAEKLERTKMEWAVLLLIMASGIGSAVFNMTCVGLCSLVDNKRCSMGLSIGQGLAGVVGFLFSMSFSSHATVLGPHPQSGSLGGRETLESSAGSAPSSPSSVKADAHEIAEIAANVERSDTEPADTDTSDHTAADAEAEIDRVIGRNRALLQWGLILCWFALVVAFFLLRIFKQNPVLRAYIENAKAGGGGAAEERERSTINLGGGDRQADDADASGDDVVMCGRGVHVNVRAGGRGRAGDIELAEHRGANSPHSGATAATNPERWDVLPGPTAQPKRKWTDFTGNVQDIPTTRNSVDRLAGDFDLIETPAHQPGQVRADTDQTPMSVARLDGGGGDRQLEVEVDRFHSFPHEGEHNAPPPPSSGGSVAQTEETEEESEGYDFDAEVSSDSGGDDASLAGSALAAKQEADMRSWLQILLDSIVVLAAMFWNMLVLGACFPALISTIKPAEYRDYDLLVRPADRGGKYAGLGIVQDDETNSVVAAAHDTRADMDVGVPPVVVDDDGIGDTTNVNLRGASTSAARQLLASAIGPLAATAVATAGDAIGRNLAAAASQVYTHLTHADLASLRMQQRLKRDGFQHFLLGMVMIIDVVGRWSPELLPSGGSKGQRNHENRWILENNNHIFYVAFARTAFIPLFLLSNRNAHFYSEAKLDEEVQGRGDDGGWMQRWIRQARLQTSAVVGGAGVALKKASSADRNKFDRAEPATDPQDHRQLAREEGTQESGDPQTNEVQGAKEEASAGQDAGPDPSTAKPVPTYLPFFTNDWAKTGLVAIFALSQGFVTTQCFVKLPMCVENVAEKKLAGNFLSFSVVIALFLGSLWGRWALAEMGMKNW